MKITNDSHRDHGLTQAHIDFILEKFGDREAFFIETVDMPAHLSPLKCEMHGPLMGDPPVDEGDVRYVVRGSRKGATRVVQRPARETRKLTVIGGPHNGECIMYTAFGGPPGAKEVWDDSIKSMEELEKARAFWKEHALSWG